MSGKTAVTYSQTLAAIQMNWIVPSGGSCMSDLKQWIWPAAAGTMGMIVAFGAGVIAGDQWVTIGLRSREQSAPSAVLDTSALRPMVHEEVERGVADAIAS